MRSSQSGEDSRAGRHFLPNPSPPLSSLGRRGGHYLNFVPADSSFQRQSRPRKFIHPGTRGDASGARRRRDEFEVAFSLTFSTNLIPLFVNNDTGFNVARNFLLHPYESIHQRIERREKEREDSFGWKTVETLRQTLITLPSNH